MFCVLTNVSGVYAEFKFSEVYPAPEKNSYEWVEIYNDSDNPVNTSEYSIFDLTGNNLMIEQLILGPYEFAIATSSSVINNSGDTLFLKNNLGEIVHTVTTPKDITSQQSFTLCGSDWKITDMISQKTPNSTACKESLSPTVIPTTSPKPTEIDTATISNIFISEALVFPEKDEYEWVELYNNSDKPIDLTNWYLDDKPQGSSPYKFSTNVDARDFAIIPIPTSIFNNDRDEIRLLSSSATIVDMMVYTSSKQGLSLSRISFVSNTSCISQATRRLANSPCFNPSNEIPVEANSNNEDQFITPTLALPISSIVHIEPTLLTDINHGLITQTSSSKPTGILPVPGKTYSLEKVHEHPSMHYARIGLFCALLTCTIHFVYSIYKYKDICVNLFTIGSQHLPG